MNTKIPNKTVIWTFCIAWAVFSCIIIANQFGYLRFGTPISTVLFFLGAMSPAIIAFMVLTKSKAMTAKHFFKTVFAVKQPVKLPFAAACLITGVIWSIWHLPLFFMEGSPQSDMNFFVFSIGSIGLQC